MLYVEFMNKVKDASLGYNEETGECYIEPDYEAYMYYLNLDPACVTDIPITKEDVRHILELQVKKMNAFNNPTRMMSIEAYDMLHNEMQPALTEETNELIKNLVEYMQKNDELDQREKDIRSKENAEDIKKIIRKYMPSGVNLTKKTGV